MRVAFIVGRFPVLSETFVINQAVGLIDRGHEVDIYAERLGDLDKVHPDVERYRLLDRTQYLTPIPENLLLRAVLGLRVGAVKLWQDPAATLRSLDVMKYGLLALSLRLLFATVPNLKTSYDIVHCQFGTQGYYGEWFKLLHAPQAKLITTFRGHDISRFVREQGTHAYDRLFKVGDFFLTNCDFFRQRVLDLGCEPDKISVLRSGLDCTRFPFKPRAYPEDGKIRIATVGRLVEKKGIEYAIRGVAEVTKQHPNLEYLIVGDGILRDHFEQLIRELGVEDKVRCLGWKNDREIYEILDRSHLFIAPSVTASDGNQDAPINVLKEAMAVGLPVISTYHGGIPELVEHGISGYLVPERNSQAIAQKLQLLIENSHRWQAMGCLGSKRVSQDYDLHQLNDRLEEVYRTVLAGSQPVSSDRPLVSSTV